MQDLGSQKYLSIKYIHRSCRPHIIIASSLMAMTPRTIVLFRRAFNYEFMTTRPQWASVKDVRLSSGWVAFIGRMRIVYRD